MNYYEHHLGDYLRDTAHLTMVEDAAYRRLLDVYYVRETPLPKDLLQCCKLVRALGKLERQAVLSVLKEFFCLTDEGYRQARADAEIKRFHAKKDKARESANARWSHDERNANAMRTHEERIQVASRSQCVGNALQSPDKEEERESPRKTARATRLPEDFQPDEAESVAIAPDLDVAAELAKFRDYWIAATGKNSTKANWPATWRNWVRRCAESGRYARRAMPHVNGGKPSIYEGLGVKWD